MPPSTDPFRALTVLSVCLTCLGGIPAVSLAAPRIPASDGTVLERLPFKPGDPVARELAQMRAELQRNPGNPEVAVRLARRYYALVAEEGDPRFLGYAQAALGPWWNLPQPPVEVQVLRASLRQFLHDFGGALDDLNQVLEREPRHAQARVLRAVIHSVQARYREASADCQALKGVSSALIAAGCAAMMDGLTGKAGAAHDALAQALSSAADATVEERLWVNIRLAELAQYQGQDARAEAYFKRALALNIADTYLLAAYADFLLDRNRSAEVVALLKDKMRSDTLMLRLVFAERALKLPTAGERQAALAARFTAAQLRGDTVHQQEEARFALHVEGNPAKALTLALENWKVQREPRDARILLEAALAAKDREAARPALQWLAESRFEDKRLAGLAQQAGGGVK